MAFLLAGLAFLAMKWFEVGPVADWPWWVVLTPFVLAVLWWHFADSIGLTQKREIRRMEARAQARRQKAVQDLGMGAVGKAGPHKRPR